jgi:hypothetical protein
MGRLGVGIGDTIRLSSELGMSNIVTIGGVGYDADISMPFATMRLSDEATDIAMARNVLLANVFSGHAGGRHSETAPVWTANGVAEGVRLVFSASISPDFYRLSEGLMERLGLEAGDVFELSYGDFSYKPDTPIVGTIVEYRHGVVYEDDAIILPPRLLPMLRNLVLASAELVIDPSMNRDLDGFREFMVPLLFRNAPQGWGSMPLELEIFDEDFTMVLEATENALLLLEVLYPVFVVLSALIAAGLAVLMTLLSMRVAPSLRVLGAAKGQVFSVLCLEPIIVCAAGILIGVVALIVAYGVEAVSPGNALLYIGGTLVGAAGASVSIVRRKPLELLQVKE